MSVISDHDKRHRVPHVFCTVWQEGQIVVIYRIGPRTSKEAWRGGIGLVPPGTVGIVY